MGEIGREVVSVRTMQKDLIEIVPYPLWCMRTVEAIVGISGTEIDPIVVSARTGVGIDMPIEELPGITPSRRETIR